MSDEVMTEPEVDGRWVTWPGADEEYRPVSMRATMKAVRPQPPSISAARLQVVIDLLRRVNFEQGLRTYDSLSACLASRGGAHVSRDELKRAVDALVASGEWRAVTVSKPVGGSYGPAATPTSVALSNVSTHIRRPRRAARKAS